MHGNHVKRLADITSALAPVFGVSASELQELLAKEHSSLARQPTPPPLIVSLPPAPPLRFLNPMLPPLTGQPLQPWPESPLRQPWYNGFFDNPVERGHGLEIPDVDPDLAMEVNSADFVVEL